jgi:NADH-quinone oxidoreductase subunit F
MSTPTLEFKPETMNKFNELLKKYPSSRSALLPTLYLAQDEFGYLSDEAIRYVADLLDLEPMQVYSTASYYVMYHRHPVGKYIIALCTNISCALEGSYSVMEHLKKILNVDAEETSEDKLFTLKKEECLGACGSGPVMLINKYLFEHLTPEKTEKIINALKSGKSLEEVHREFQQTDGRSVQEIHKTGKEVLLKRAVESPVTVTFESYQQQGGYAAWKKALTEMKPADVIEQVKQAGVRGRGGAGFPAGMKWSFVPKNIDKPRYLVCNGDESEPGTFKDRQIMERDPHLLIEGVCIASYAIESHHAFIYIRGEYPYAAMRVEQAIEDAKKAGIVGKNIFGTGYDLEITVHSGAGAYECGEESAQLDSIEGKRGEPRLRPPFPAVKGLYGCPTIINNVETLSNVPAIITNGPQWYTAMGTEKNSGTKIYNVSGHVVKPGPYELPMGITLRELIYDYCGGIRDGRKLKAVIPGGASTPILTADEIDVKMDFDSLAKAGTMLGSAAVIVMDDRTCIVQAALRIMEFFRDESCGKCTPCREGTYWMANILRRIENGQGKMEDLDLLLDVCSNITGRSFCPFGDAEVGFPTSSIKKFREEYEYHIKHKKCMVSGELRLI